jgi:hypothetical protein
MARGKVIGEPPFMAPACTRRHLFKRPDASYPRVTEDMAMKLGLAIGYSGAHMDLPNQARHRHHAACRANAGQRRHVGCQH